jgi:hypothetical protein
MPSSKTVFSLYYHCLDLSLSHVLLTHSLLSLLRLTEQLIRGVWKSQIVDGRMMEVLIHEDDGKMMASRIPGDPRCEWGIY